MEKKKIAKYTFEQVKEIFEQNNCELLSTEYTKNTNILHFKCKCGIKNEIMFKKYLVQLCCNDCHKQTLVRRFKYTYKEVKEIFEKSGCQLLSTEYNNQLQKLDYICKCNNKAKIPFKQFVKGNRCTNCAIQKRKETNLERYGNEVSMNSEELKEIWVHKVKNRSKEERESINNKRKETNLEKYGKEHTLQVPELRELGKQTMMEKYGGSNVFESKEIAARIKQTNLERYGVEYVGQNPEIKEKIKTTNLERYGVVCTAQHPETKEKMKATNLERYGFECTMQNPDIREKAKATNLERYGFECSMQNPDIREKAKATNLERYGFECVMQNPEIKEKAKATNLERYGFEYSCQNAEVQEKIFKYRMKKYRLPSGKEILIQGYENYALDILLSKYDEDEILTQKTDMPVIKYYLGKKTKRYFPDIYIPHENKIIEVKSIWTYRRNLVKNNIKALSTRSLGFEYETWVFNEKGQIILSL